MSMSKTKTKPRPWMRLDNVAKIFPPTSTRKDTKVFRFACELKEQVDPAVLQDALELTLEQFPLYRSVMKKGLFWYYLEASHLKPTVYEEDKPPCGPIYSGDRKTLLFEVTYFQRRINLDVYHALSDGTGALHFLRTLVLYYLTKKHDIPQGEGLHDYDASQFQKQRDSFYKYFSERKIREPVLGKAAYRFRGEKFPEYRLGVIEGMLPSSQVLALAKSKGATLSEYLCTVLFLAIHEGMTVQDTKKPVVLTVPVNLRRFFPSQSARNFFGVVNIGHRFSGPEDFDTVLECVKALFADALLPETLEGRMNRLSALEHNLAGKVVPLSLKNMVLRVANMFANREITAAFSNVGRVTMPPEVADYIDRFDIFCSTARLQVCLCSYGERLVISFTSPFVSSDVQRCFFRHFTQLGIPVEITATLPGLDQEEQP